MGNWRQGRPTGGWRTEESMLGLWPKGRGFGDVKAANSGGRGGKRSSIAVALVVKESAAKVAVEEKDEYEER